MNNIQVPRDGFLHSVSEVRLDGFIPTERPQNHAANLCRLPDGTLSCVWFGGTMEGMPDISIHQSFFDEQRQCWSAPVVYLDDPARSEQNPLLFIASDEEVWLLYTSQVSGNQDTAVVRRRVSRDGGKTFGLPHTLIDTPGTFVRQPIMRIENALLLPVFRCVSTPDKRWRGDRDTSALYRSTDNGQSWQLIHVPDSTGCVHMNLLPVAQGKLVALFRSRWADAIYLSRSEDAGRSWSVPVPTRLPNNNSSVQAISLKDGRIALVYNHSSAEQAVGRRTSLYDDLHDAQEDVIKEDEQQAFWGAPRAPLSLIFSSDGCQTWSERIDLEVGDGYCLSNNSADQVNRELSYPSICEAPDGSLDIAFTYFRQAIKHVRLMASNS